MILVVVALMTLAPAAAVASEKGELWEQPISTDGRALDCSNAIPINYGDSVSGDNAGLPDNATYYSRTGCTERGG